MAAGNFRVTLTDVYETVTGHGNFSQGCEASAASPQTNTWAFVAAVTEGAEPVAVAVAVVATVETAATVAEAAKCCRRD